ncbi:hypothetical protein E2C01_079643 [Portunus trituberculatus]|uniref:Uncharacterized protein n=1 Tax=Portunus trituberculatus TaxID=210409 RepID=A0A5B7IM16_PORTR|nr:hypothetical protein [Portunus trituberculatus]
MENKEKEEAPREHEQNTTPPISGKASVNLVVHVCYSLVRVTDSRARQQKSLPRRKKVSRSTNDKRTDIFIQF